MKKRFLSVLLSLCLVVSLFPALALPAFAAGQDTFSLKSGAAMPTSPMNSVAFGNGAYVSVGYDGAIVRSTDGQNWSSIKDKVDVPFYPGITSEYLDGSTTFVFWGVAFGNGKFVAAGDCGVILASLDGLTWMPVTSPVTKSITDVKYLTWNGVGAFYALTQGGYLTSPDGIAWTMMVPTGMTPQSAPTDISVGNNGTRLVIGMCDTSNGWGEGRIVSSTGGAWTSSPPLFSLEGQMASSINFVTWVNDRYVLSDPYGYIWTSVDLTSFTQVGAPFKENSADFDNQMFTALYANGTYYLFGSQQPQSSLTVYTSPDFVNWAMQPYTHYFTSQNSQYLNGLYFCAGNEGLLVSSDGFTWKNAWGNAYYDVIYDGSKYVAAGRIGGDGAIWTSTDLSNWTQASLSARTSYFYAAAAGNGKYVAVGANTNSNSVSALATSSDGFNWTAVNTQTGVMRDVAFGSGLFVAVGTDSSKAALRTSTDGVTWTVPTLPATSATLILSVTYTNGQFVALGSGLIWTSPDSITWTDRSASYTAAGEVPLDLVYTGGTYVLLGYRSAAPRTLFTRTSSDLSTWSGASETGCYYTGSVGGKLGVLGDHLYVLGRAGSTAASSYCAASSPDLGVSWSMSSVDFGKMIPYALSSVNGHVLFTGNSGLVMSGEVVVTPAISVQAAAPSDAGSTYGAASAAKTYTASFSDYALAPQNVSAVWCASDGTAAGAPAAGTNLTVGAYDAQTGKLSVTFSTDPSADAGDYYIKITSDADSGKTPAAAVVKFTVSKAAYAPLPERTVPVITGAVRSGSVKLSDLFSSVPADAAFTSVTAPASPAVMDTVAINGSDAGQLDYTSKNNPAGTTASDTYTVTITSRNYQDLTATLVFAPVPKTAVTISGLTAPASLSYSGAPVSGSVFGTPAAVGQPSLDSTLVYTYTGTGSTVYGPSAAAPTNAGTYQLTVSVPQSNTDFTGSVYVPFTIAPAKITVSAGSAKISKVYDGTAGAGTLSGALSVSGILPSDSGVSVQVGAVPAYAAKGVISNGLLGLPVSLSGDTLGNYQLSSGTVSVPAAITAKDVTVSGITAADKVYDGKTAATPGTGSAVLDGKLSADSLSLTVSGTFDTAEAGQNKTVSLHIDLTGSDAGNYRLSSGTQTTATASISPAPVTISASDQTAWIGGSVPSLTDYTASGLLSGQKLTVLPTLSYAAVPDMTVPGTVAIKVSGADAGSNYTITYQDGLLTILARPVVTFNSNGGSAVASIPADDSGKVAAPAAPTRQGYTFTGWYADGALTQLWQFASDTVSRDLTLYARWTADGTADSLVEVTGPATPPVTVTGLDAEADAVAAQQADPTASVVVKMTVEKKAESDLVSVPAVKAAVDAIRSSLTAGADKQLSFEFLDISLTKIVTTSTGSATSSRMGTTSRVLEIVIPYDTTGKENIRVLQYHEGEGVRVFTPDSTRSGADGTCYVDAAAQQIHLFTQKFSTYAISYETALSPAPVTPSVPGAQPAGTAPVSPATGDTAGILFWITAAAVSGVCGCAFVWSRKKHSDRA